MNIQPESAPRHKYDYDFDIQGPAAPARAARMSGENKRVLEIGSGPGALTRVLTEHCKHQVTALELDEQALALVKAHCEQAHRADLNRSDWPSVLQGLQYDRVIAADVLEHVERPLDVLKGMVALLAPEGEIILSLPHVGHCGIAACLASNNFRYGEWGLLDKTHIKFFGIKNMEALLAAAGLKAVHVEFVVKHPHECEFADLWDSLEIGVKNGLLFNPFALVYQVVLRAAPLDRSQKAIALMDVPVETWRHPMAVPERILGLDSRGAVAKAIRLPGRVIRTIGRALP